MRGEVHDGIWAMFGQRGVDGETITQVAFDKDSIGVDSSAVALAKVIEDDDCFAVCEQLFNDNTANIARTTGHKDFHTRFLSTIYRKRA